MFRAVEACTTSDWHFPYSLVAPAKAWKLALVSLLLLQHVWSGDPAYSPALLEPLKCVLVSSPILWIGGIANRCLHHFLVVLGDISIHVFRPIFLHDVCYSPAPNSSYAPGSGRPCESISSKQLIITHISPFIYIPTWTNKQNKEILPGQINCFTSCCDPFANLGWPPWGGRINTAGRRKRAMLSYWYHQFNLVEGPDEFP